MLYNPKQGFMSKKPCSGLKGMAFIECRIKSEFTAFQVNMPNEPWFTKKVLNIKKSL